MGIAHRGDAAHSFHHNLPRDQGQFRRFLHVLQSLLHLGIEERENKAGSDLYPVAAEVRQLFEPLQVAVHARQKTAQYVIGWIAQEMLVFIGLHVFLFHELVLDVVGKAAAGPFHVGLSQQFHGPAGH